MEADVCVVGAGFAGLAAARQIVAAGRSVVVLEARDRVGGRTWADIRAGGATLDRGGAWLSPRHSTAFALARDLGIPIYKTHVAGSHLLVSEGRIRRYKGLIPKISPIAVAQLAAAQWRIDRMARRVSLEEPWASTQAAAWDAETVGQWLDGTKIRSRAGRELFEMAVRGLFAATDLNDVSLLHLLYLVRAHERIESLFSIEGGAQENLVEGGLGALAAAVATQLGEAVHLSTPVRSVSQQRDVLVVADGISVTSRYAVVAVPPSLIPTMRFDPTLGDERSSLHSLAAGGVETKTLVVYDRPFWRDLGLSGQSAEPGSAAEVTIDSSPRDAAFGVLASFTFGAVAERFDALSASERRSAVLAALAARFGPRAAAPVDYVETAWWHEEWSRGCSTAHFPPGVLTRFGPLLRAPHGRIHWAGTETATFAHGSVEGALRSGNRAAHEVLALLAAPADQEQ